MQERSVYLKAMKNLTRSDLWRKDQKNIKVSFDRRRKQQNEYYKYWKLEFCFEITLWKNIIFMKIYDL